LSTNGFEAFGQFSQQATAILGAIVTLLFKFDDVVAKEPVSRD
jgi:hypothetical protein